MLDRSIPHANMILRCDEYEVQEIRLPAGFEIVGYREGFEEDWARLEVAIGDFASIDEARAYFVEKYLGDSAMRDRVFFAVDSDGQVVGSCIAWRDERGEEQVGSLHWLVVSEHVARQGIGRALTVAAMNYFASHSEFPVYLHTQPWSWKAILLYISLSFTVQRTDTFGGYPNDWAQARGILRDVLPDDQFRIVDEAAAG